jgi:predicted site-specific integrase-resolvase
MKHTLSQAATATGKSKATIQRAIKSGKISARKASSGAYEIDPSELHRVFPATVKRVSQHPNETILNSMKRIQESPDINAIQRIANLEKELAVMEARKNGLEDQKQNLTESVDDLRRRLDTSEGRVTALLSDQRPKGFWKRLFS